MLYRRYYSRTEGVLSITISSRQVRYREIVLLYRRSQFGTEGYHRLRPHPNAILPVRYTCRSVAPRCRAYSHAIDCECFRVISYHREILVKEVNPYFALCIYERIIYYLGR